jgi:hypothetical protein
MILTNLSLSRRHVLGDLYPRCDTIEGQIPVYLTSDDEPTMLGYAEQSSLGNYADAVTFHLNAEYCRKLSSGQFAVSIAYDLTNSGEPGARSRVKLTSISLTGKKSYEKPAPKSNTPAE